MSSLIELGAKRPVVRVLLVAFSWPFMLACSLHNSSKSSVKSVNSFEEFRTVLEGNPCMLLLARAEQLHDPLFPSTSQNVSDIKVVRIPLATVEAESPNLDFRPVQFNVPKTIFYIDPDAKNSPLWQSFVVPSEDNAAQTNGGSFGGSTITIRKPVLSQAVAQSGASATSPKAAPCNTDSEYVYGFETASFSTVIYMAEQGRWFSLKTSDSARSEGIAIPGEPRQPKAALSHEEALRGLCVSLHLSDRMRYFAEPDAILRDKAVLSSLSQAGKSEVMSVRELPEFMQSCNTHPRKALIPRFAAATQPAWLSQNVYYDRQWLSASKKWGPRNLIGEGVEALSEGLTQFHIDLGIFGGVVLPRKNSHGQDGLLLVQAKTNESAHWTPIGHGLRDLGRARFPKGFAPNSDELRISWRSVCGNLNPESLYTTGSAIVSGGENQFYVNIFPEAYYKEYEDGVETTTESTQNYYKEVRTAQAKSQEADRLHRAETGGTFSTVDADATYPKGYIQIARKRLKELLGEEADAQLLPNRLPDDPRGPVDPRGSVLLSWQDFTVANRIRFFLQEKEATGQDPPEGIKEWKKRRDTPWE